MSKTQESRRSLSQRIGAVIDSCVSVVDPKAGNARWAARARRELAEDFIDRRRRKFSTDRSDDSGGGGFRSAQRTADQQNWLTSRLSPDSALEQDRAEMCRRADSAYKNYELATAHVEGRVVRVAGCGMTVDPDIDFEEIGRGEDEVDEINLVLRKGWERTVCRLGKRGEELWEIQHLMVRYWERRGEWFVLVGDRYDALAPTTLKIEVIHPDRVETPPSSGSVSNIADAPWIGDQYVRMGMQLTRDGDVIGCYIRDTHPGDDKLIKETFTYFPILFPNGLPRVIHHFAKYDEGQHRGYPRMQSGMKRLKNAEEYDEAELERNYVGACLAAIVRTELPVDDVAAQHGVVEDSDGRRQRDVVPGMFHYVGESDAVETLNPSGAPQSFDKYMEYEGRMFSVGAGSTYEMVSGNWGNLAYNAARIIWNLDEAKVDVDQRGHIKTVVAIYWHYVMRMVVTGQVEIDALAFRSEPWLYCACRPIAPARASIDPSREDRNEMVLIEGNIKPHSDMVERKTGQPASTIYRRIAQCFKLMKLWDLNPTMPNMGRDGEAEGKSPTQAGDKNQDSSDANSEPTEAVAA